MNNLVKQLVGNRRELVTLFLIIFGNLGIENVFKPIPIDLEIFVSATQLESDVEDRMKVDSNLLVRETVIKSHHVVIWKVYQELSVLMMVDRFNNSPNVVEISRYDYSPVSMVYLSLSIMPVWEETPRLFIHMA